MLASNMFFQLNAQNSSEMWFCLFNFPPTLFSMCACACPGHMFRGQETQPKELVLSFYHLGPEDETQVFTVSTMQSHLTGPWVILLF